MAFRAVRDAPPPGRDAADDARTVAAGPPGERPSGRDAVDSAAVAAGGSPPSVADDAQTVAVSSPGERPSETTDLGPSGGGGVGDAREDQKPPPQRPQRQFEDGMGDGSDVETTLGSADLLGEADEGDEDEGGRSGTEDAQPEAAAEDAAAAACSPMSPATQTLNRLSKFGSQEGGAELCICLLSNGAEDNAGGGGGGVSGMPMERMTREMI